MGIASASNDPWLPTLRIDLQALERRGADVHHLRIGLDRAWLAEALDETDAEADRDGSLDLELTLQHDGTILVRGRLQAGFAVPCARCLEPAAVDAGAQICVSFVPHGHARAGPAQATADGDEGVSLNAEDLETLVYRGHVLDLRGLIAEQVVLGYPMRVLCRRGQACRGLCTGCGSNLNALPAEATHCAGCGLPLSEVSQAPAERSDDSSGPEAPWRAALRRLRTS